MNPLRYRGYYYDNETGYYYLQSRYYDPGLGRFISADDFSYIDASEKFSINAYAYCANNPVNFSDPSGHKANIDDPNYLTNSVVQIIFTIIEIGGIINWIEETSTLAFSLLQQLVDLNADFVSIMFLTITSVINTFFEIALDGTTIIINSLTDLLVQMLDFALDTMISSVTDIQGFIGDSLDMIFNDIMLSEFQKIVLMILDGIGLILPFVIPNVSFGGGLAIGVVASIVNLIVKGIMRLANGFVFPVKKVKK